MCWTPREKGNTEGNVSAVVMRGCETLQNTGPEKEWGDTSHLKKKKKNPTNGFL